MAKSAGISARITEATKARLEAYATTIGIPKSEIIEEAINKYLDVAQNVIQEKEPTATSDLNDRVEKLEAVLGMASFFETFLDYLDKEREKRDRKSGLRKELTLEEAERIEAGGEKMARIPTIVRNCKTSLSQEQILAAAKGEGSEELRETYEKEIAPYFYWKPERNEFFWK